MRVSLLSLLSAGVLLAAHGTQAGELEQARAAIAAKLPGIEQGDIVPGPIPGLYEVSIGAQVAYATADGRLLFSGDIIDLNTRTNLTEDRRNEARLAALSKLEEGDMVVFSPPPEKVRHTLTVFTDIDCAYCRKLHSEMNALNAAGIKVRYLFYPRTGPGTESWRKAVSVWCSSNRQEAMTRAKAGAQVETLSCANPPVLRQYELGQLMGVTGTPALIADDGELLAGYLPADMLAARLDEIGSQ